MSEPDHNLFARPCNDPPLLKHVIGRRESLREKLQQGLGRRLIIVQASAGYGKTAFLAGFARHQNNTEGIATAWLKLDRIHQDRVVLLHGLAQALQAIRPRTGNVTCDALRKTKDVHRRWEYFLELFRRELQESEGPPALIIVDQYERAAPSPAAQAIIDGLASALPSGLTLLLSTRQPPSLACIPRLKTDGSIVMLSASDLCLSADETRELLSKWLGASPAHGTVNSILTRTGGWPAGVQMAGAFASLQGEKALLTFSGSQPEFYEHLCQGLFDRRPDKTRSLLRITALADDVSPALVQSLAGEEAAGDVLAGLWEGSYPGLVSETKDGPVHHHNPIFRNFLLRTLETNLTRRQLLDLHIRLAKFYSRSKEWDASLDHLLTAGEYQRASELVTSLAEEAISSNSLETLTRWLNAFPREERNTHPWLLLYEGVIHRVERDWEKALSSYSLAADVFRREGVRSGLARTLWYASQVLTYRRNQRLATLFASEALTYLETSDLRSRAWVLHTIGNSYFDLGQPEDALKCHEEAMGLFSALGDELGQLMQSQAMGWALHRLGRLKEAQHHYVRALDQQAKSGDVNMLCWLEAGLAHVRAMRGDYPEALAALNEIVGVARKHHLLPAEAFALSNLVDIHLDLGDHAQAENCYWQAVTACGEFDDDAPQIGLHLKRMELELRRGQPYLPLPLEPPPNAQGDRRVPPPSLNPHIESTPNGGGVSGVSQSSPNPHMEPTQNGGGVRGVSQSSPNPHMEPTPNTRGDGGVSPSSLNPRMGPLPAGRGDGGVSPPSLNPLMGPSLSLTDWVQASNLEITKIAHDLQTAFTLLAEKRYEEAGQRASQARSLSNKIGFRYHYAQACYLLARAYLLQDKPDASARLVEELLTPVQEEGYAGFLVRDPEATGELLMNAFHHSPAKDQIAALLLRLADIKEEVATPFLPGACAPATESALAAKDRLAALLRDFDAQCQWEASRPWAGILEAPVHKDTGGAPRPVQGELEIFLLGPLRVRRRAHLVTERAWRTSKAKELFAYLLTCPSRTATRDQLLDVLWPELNVDAAVSNFHFTLHSLRRALEPELKPGLTSSYVLLSGRHYSLQLPSETWIDVQEFKACLSRGSKRPGATPDSSSAASLKRAIKLYRGDFLADLYVDWIEPIRRDLAAACQDALRHLAYLAYTRHDYEDAIHCALDILKKDSYVEDAYRLIMRAACEKGNSALALRQYEDLARLLRDELDAQPEAATQQLYRQIRDGVYQRA